VRRSRSRITKERLLAEVARRDCQLRLEVIDERLAGARSADDVVEALVASIQGIVRDDPESLSVVCEVFTLSRRNDEIAAAYGDLLRSTRDHVAALLQAKHDEGVLRLRAEAAAVADVLVSLGDGVAMRMLARPGDEFDATIRAGADAVRALID
jgi:AcrR family transcriptional regulator